MNYSRHTHEAISIPTDIQNKNALKINNRTGYIAFDIF